MNFHSLKTAIAINIAILLFIAMFLIDFVMINTSMKQLLESDIARGRLLSLMIEQNIAPSQEKNDIELKSDFLMQLKQIIADLGFSCALINNKSGRLIHSSCENCEIQEELAGISQQTLKSGKQSTTFLGATWGIFWKSDKYIVISNPLLIQGATAGCVNIVLQLEGFYSHLRHSQKIVLLYILTNTIILTFIGVLLLYRMTVKPVNRLVKRAEEYTDYSRPLFSREKENNEFGLLSKSLNKMLVRISEDKEEIQESLRSLENANIELKSAQKEIVRGEKLASIGRLSAGIAHEIGNPIGIVLGYLELLKQNDITDDEKEEYVKRTENEINRINTIVKQLLDFSRPSSGIPVGVPTHAIIHDLVDVIKLQPFMAGIELKLNLLAENDMVFAEPNQLRQVFLNLIINAADAISSNATGIKGKIQIQTEIANTSDKGSSGGRPELNILFKDNGHGIPEENLDNIFDPFYTSKEPGQGTGLGLSVCFWIVDSMGGKIIASSTKNNGTIITILLPIHISNKDQ